MKRTIIVLTAALVGLAGVQSIAIARSKQKRAPSPVSAARSTTPTTTVAIDGADRGVDRVHLLPVLSNPDARNPKGRLIEISIPDQRITAWQDGVVVMRVVISTGARGYETPTGHYRVIFKSPKAWSSKWKVWMPWAMNWHGNYFIHQLPHYPGSSVNIGASELGRPVSHGCVRVNVGDAERLFRWASVGTPVWVH